MLGLLAWGPVHSLILGGSVKVGINLFLDGVPVFVFDLIDLLRGKKSLWAGMIGYVAEKKNLKVGLKDGKKKWCCWRGMGKKEQKNRWRRMVLVTQFGFCLANSHSAQVPLTSLFHLY